MRRSKTPSVSCALASLINAIMPNAQRSHNSHMAVKRGGLHSVSDLVWIWQITHLTLARGNLLRDIDKKTVNTPISICLLMFSSEYSGISI